jgi:hypothetical protein
MQPIWLYGLAVVQRQRLELLQVSVRPSSEVHPTADTDTRTM